MSLRTPLGRVRGLGSARSGAHHWMAQRLTALALVPLTLWFVISLISVVGADREAVVAWLSSPVSAALMIALIFATFYHASLGMQVIYEDYVANGALRHALDIGTKFLCFLLGLAASVSVLMLALGG